MSLDRSTPPQINDFGMLTIPEPQAVTLLNGIKLYIINSGLVPVNNIFISWNRGEADVKSPVALRLMVNSLNEGTSKHSGAQIANIFESNGSWVMYGCSLHETYISAFSLNSNVNKIIPTLIEIISDPVFDNDTFEIKRNKHVTDLKIKLEKVLYQASVAMLPLSYGPDHPFSVEEMPDQVASLTRNDIVRQYENVIAKYPPTIYLSGMIDTQLTQTVVEAFSKLKFKDRTKPYDYVPRQAAAPGTVARVSMPDKKQSAIKIIIPTINSAHPDFQLLNIAVTALGGYFGSRLSANIREDKGYTYGIRAMLISFKEGGSMSITCECDNQYVDAVIEETKKELTRLASEPMSDEELHMVIQYMKSSLASTLDTPFSIAEYHRTLIRRGVTSSEFYDIQNLLTTVTPDDIRDIAARYLTPDKIITAIAGKVS